MKRGVALSGGGYRAGAWALGVLLYMADEGILDDVDTISSVSGGSITNAFIAARRGPNETLSACVNRAAPELAAFYARSGGWLGSRPLGVLVAMLAVLGLSAVVSLVAALVLASLASPWAPYAMVALGASLALLFLAWCSRTKCVLEAYDENICDKKVLKDLASGTAHVFCATDVQYNEHVYMSQKFVYAYRMGVAEPGKLPLSFATAASAAFPGAFAPLTRPASSFDWTVKQDHAPPGFVLYDGGVYDNMGEQWFVGMDDDKRAREIGKMTTRDQTAGEKAKKLLGGLSPFDELWVVNASEAFPKKNIPAWYARLELPVLSRVGNGLHDNSTSLRRKQLVAEFRAGTREGTTVHVETLTTTAKTSDKARKVLEGAGLSTKTFAAYECAKVTTTLAGLGDKTVVDLVHHAYVLAAIQGHEHRGRPAPKPADLARTKFEAILDRGLNAARSDVL